jgi:hypothetical protein
MRKIFQSKPSGGTNGVIPGRRDQLERCAISDNKHDAIQLVLSRMPMRSKGDQGQQCQKEAPAVFRIKTR